MRKKLLSIILTISLVTMGVVACGEEKTTPTEIPVTGENEESETAQTDEEIIIGFSNLSENYAFFATVKESMQKACDAAGVKMLYGTDDQNAEIMKNNWDSFVNQGADIIVDATVLPEAGSALATQYKENVGIPVLSVDCRYDNAYFFGVNNEGAGEVAGKFLAEKVKEKWDGQVDCMLQFYLESNGEEVKLRNSGIYKGLIENGIDLSEEKVEWLNAQGTSAVGYDASVMKGLITDYLTAHQDQHRIVMGCFTDDGAAAALAAVEASGRQDDVLIVSHNADNIALENLALEGENSWVGTVCYSPATYGDQIVDACLKILKGEDVSDSTYAETFVISDENINEHYKK